MVAASTLLTAAVLTCRAFAAPPWVPQEFRTWATEYGKKYRTEGEWRNAYKNFADNEKIIETLNAEDGATYGHTRFSDMSPHEWKATYFGSAMDPVVGRAGGSDNALIPTSAPDAFDWRTQGAVTPVKDQGSCGSCWAESAVGNMESQWYLANKASMTAPVMLSVEQIIECDANDDACYGGFPKGAFEYVIAHGGLATLADYPNNFESKTICLANQTFNQTCGDGMCDDPPLTSWCDITCSDKTHKSAAKISSWTALPTDEDQIAAYLAEHGPVSVAIDASGGGMGILFPWLQFYKSGVANPKHCTKTLDHAVLLVGYGTDSGTPYWTIKNSWGASFGESGYFRMARGQGVCGVNTLATSSVVNGAGPDVVV